ncbi:MAG TPA: hypothetical protein VFE62_12265 [Gemmataceae bacterium]|nr:hypothetical protein [Gemmataceae bacterium]
MTATAKIPNCDVAMLARIFEPERGDLSIAAARAFLKFDFVQSDRDRMHELLEKARAGRLSAAENEELEDYDRVGHLLALLHSKARKTMKKQANGKHANGR